MCEARSGNPLFHQADVVHHTNAVVLNLKHLIDLHASRAVAVVQHRIPYDDAALGIDYSDPGFRGWSPGLGAEIAFVAAVISRAGFNAVPAVVRDAVAAVEPVATRVIVGFDRLVVC